MRLRLVALLVLGTFLAVYLPDSGHGFSKDDFSWIRDSTFETASGAFSLFERNVGFYRPLVAISFGADYAVWGLHPLGYGITNLLLCLADALLLFALVRRFALPAAAALMATTTWLFNFHGINMALLWLSGRTALMLTLFGLATVHAFLSDRRLIAGVLCLGALLCKEEAVMLPLIVASFAAIEKRDSRWHVRLKHAAAVTWPQWISVLVYLAFRTHSGAFGPHDAPSYYRFSLSSDLLIRNMAEYADRAGTVPVVVILALAAGLAQRPPRLLQEERSALWFAIAWFCGMYGLTVFLPVRSSLYAVAPSIGTALAVAVCASVLARARADRFRRVAAVLLIIVLASYPIYRARNVRWVRTAKTTASVLDSLQAVTAARPEGGRLSIVDDPQERFNLAAGFGSAFPDAVVLFLGPQWEGSLVEKAEGTINADLVLCYRNGAVIRPVPALPRPCP